MTFHRVSFFLLFFCNYAVSMDKYIDTATASTQTQKLLQTNHFSSTYKATPRKAPQSNLFSISGDSSEIFQGKHLC